jgi:hypothetical protein
MGLLQSFTFSQLYLFSVNYFAMTMPKRKQEECRKAGNKLNHWNVVMRPAFLLSSPAAINRRHCEAFDCPNSKLLKKANPWIGQEKAEAISYSPGAI